MPFGKDRGYANQGGELVRVNSELARCKDMLEEALSTLETCADPTCGVHIATFSQKAIDRINRMKQK
jgi:hypothetical protein